MAGPNVETAEGRAALNAENQKRRMAEMDRARDAATERSAAPATEKPTALDVKNGGGGGWMKNSFAAAVSAVSGMKEGMSNTIDGLAIKPYQGSTTVERYTAQTGMKP